MKKNHLIFLLFLCAFLTTKAQTDHVKIILKSENIPVSFASINVENKQMGTVSNNEGEFILQTFSLSDIDSVMISSVGFTTLKLNIGDLKLKNGKVLEMQKSNFLLSEVIVKPISIKDDLKKAIETTEKSLVTKANLSGYYREYVYNNALLSKFADAAIDTYFEKRDKENIVQIKVNESRAKDALSDEKQSIINLMQSPISINSPFEKFFNLDKIKLRIEKADQYDFYEQDIDQNTYKISVIPKADIEEPLQQAIILIDKGSNKIESINYLLAGAQIKYSKKVNILGITISNTGSNIKLIFQNDLTTSYLKYVDVSVSMRIVSKKYNDEIRFKSDFLISNIQTENPIQIPNKEQYKKRNLYKNGDKFNDEFWLKYNTILPTKAELKEIGNIK